MRLSDMKIWLRLTAGIWLLLVFVWTGMVFWESQVNRNTAIEQATRFSQSMHEATLAGLTGMMITGTVGQREVFLDQIKQLSIIRDLRVIRGEAVTKLYGPGKAGEGQPDATERQVLDSGKEFIEVQQDGQGEYLRVVRPALASKNYLGKDCIACHQTPEGTVLGVVSMKVSLDDVEAAIATQRIKILLAAIGVSIPVMLFIWFFITRVVTRPLENMVAGLRAIASGEGDLTRRLEVKSNDEIGQASLVFNEMMANFANLVRQVDTSAKHVSTAARDLVEGARQVAESSRQQSGKSAAVTDAVERMVRSIVAVAESAERVHAQSQESLARSREGRQSLERLIGEIGRVKSAVDEMAAAVNEFVSSTASITNMTREVKDIADQTNLLALNAAIEAARAGEAGRGFAVVADEVRKLAEKSAASANEIDIITRTLGAKSDLVRNAIESGLADIASSEQSLAAVANAINESNASVEEVGRGLDTIAAATEEQRQVSAAALTDIEAIAAMARENSTAVEQNAMSAQRLETLAGELQSTVGRFRT
ncbi:methyl-accepting chemotaxis protein [Sulfuricystis multivorans]|uniref:methyl-accepting chemotaxis protein n=1 Tax=Sulfuricystis multivorans TaxID=2211108 RepID=UPI000F81CC80|nr:methyl-accepting chemotaxis protein [Sulfuricystis multivorans]